MQDRPSYDELLGAVERFLEQEIMPNVEGSRRFHARVAANVLRIVRRELEREEEQLAAEWAGLCELLGPAEFFATSIHKLPVLFGNPLTLLFSGFSFSLDSGLRPSPGSTSKFIHSICSTIYRVQQPR